MAAGLRRGLSRVQMLIVLFLLTRARVKRMLLHGVSM